MGFLGRFERKSWFEVKILTRTAARCLWIKAYDESEAAEIAQSKCLWAGRVMSVRYHGRA